MVMISVIVDHFKHVYIIMTVYTLVFRVIWANMVCNFVLYEIQTMVFFIMITGFTSLYYTDLITLKWNCRIMVKSLFIVYLSDCITTPKYVMIPASLINIITLKNKKYICVHSRYEN